MDDTQDEYDPERALWVCGRRSFMFLFGGTALGVALGVKPAYGTNGWVAITEPMGQMVEIVQWFRWGEHLRNSHLGVFVGRGFETHEPSLVPRADIEHHGLTRVSSQRIWHLSDDGAILWRDPAGPIVGESLGSVAHESDLPEVDFKTRYARERSALGDEG